MIYLFLIPVLIFFLFIWFPNWSSHIMMVKKTTNRHIVGSFKTFLNEFNKYDKWTRDDKWKYSYFGVDENWESYRIHANIIAFGGTGLILYPHSYIRFRIWTFKNRVTG